MCCGAGNAAGKLPTNSYLLGEENGAVTRFVRVLDSSILPVGKGTVYVRGTGVEQAIEDGLLEDASVQQVKRGETVTSYRVTKPDGSDHDFEQYQQARMFSTREGGQIRVIKTPVAEE